MPRPLRRHMQAALFLLLFGSLQRVVGRNQAEAGEPVRLGYEDLIELAPEYAASSWRGIMGKLVGRGWVLKTLLNQRTVFVITKLGERRAAALFPAFSASTESQLEVTLLLVRPLPGVKVAIARLQSVLRFTSFQPVSSGVYWLRGRWYDETLLRQLEEVGYQATVATLPGSSFRPFALEHFGQQNDTAVMALRQLEELSRESVELLNSLLEAKSLKSPQIQRLGRITVSGLNFLAETGEQLGALTLGREKMNALLQSLDFAAREYARKRLQE